MAENSPKVDQQMLAVIAQYTKDLSFENITPASSLPNYTEQPKIDIQLNVEVEKNIGKDIHGVSLIINVEAKIDKPIFILQLTYKGEFSIQGFENELVEPILYVECPRLLFPFARSIIAQAVSEGGFPPLYLAPINFAELYQQQVASKNQTIQ